MRGPQKYKGLLSQGICLMNKEEKRVSRCVCLQSLYALEMSNAKEEEIIKHFYINSDEIYKGLSSNQITYVKQILKLCKKHKNSIDELINTKLMNWDMSRLALIDKLILRMAISEMLYVDEVPPKEFSTKDSSRFVNGILDAVYNNVIKNNLKQTN